MPSNGKSLQSPLTSQKLGRIYDTAPRMRVSPTKGRNRGALATQGPVKLKKRKTYPMRVRKTSQLSPFASKILQSLSPNSKSRMRKQLQFDDEVLSANETEDDFVADNQLDPIAWGKHMEYVLSSCGQCPSCSSRFHMFSNPNMPAVDLVCTNLSCGLFFQVKTSFGNSYFTKKSISVGSDTYNKVICDVTSHSDLVSKHTVHGFILFSLKENADSTVSLNSRKSFCLVPRLTIQTDDPIHFYSAGPNNFFGKSTVQWDTTVVEQKSIQSVFPDPIVLSADDQFRCTKIIIT